jgi:phytoene dehydrogenase-like protein
MRNPAATDLVVIGGGLAGLAAATLAARRGRRVRLFEKAGDLGGRATTQVKDGFAFNVGPHALYRGDAAMRVLGELGITPRGATPRPSGGHAVRAGVKHPFPSGFLSLLSTGLLSLAGKLEVARLLARIQALDLAPWQGSTVNQWLAAVTQRDDVRQLLGALVRLTTYGNAPDRQSGGAALEQVQGALRDNVLYLDGGWQQLVEALRAAAAAAGVTIESGLRADAVELDAAGSAVRGVRLADGRTVSCAAAILAVPPADAAELLSGPARRTIDGWAAQATPLRAACLDLALAALPEPRSTFGLGIDAPLYFSVHSAVAKLSPEGGALVHVAKYLDPSASEDSARDLTELERFTDLLQPGWQSRVVHRRFLPHMVVTHGLVTAAQGGKAGRPGPQVDGASGLYVAGDWVGPDGMLADASLASARRAAESYVRDVAALAVAA